MIYACNCLKIFHSFELGQRDLEFGHHDRIMNFKLQKDISKKYSETSPRLIGDRSHSLTTGPGKYVSYIQRESAIPNMSNYSADHYCHSSPEF